MPTRTASISLFCPFADGAGSQSQTVPLADFDAEHHSVPAPTWVINLNNQPALLDASVDSAGIVKIKTKAPRGSVVSATVKISDGRTLIDGSPTPLFVVSVALSDRPDASGPELAAAGLGPVVDEAPLLG